MTAKASTINFFSFNTPQMKAFHMSWIAFFLCFFAWFGPAVFWVQMKAELGLSDSDKGNMIIAAVSSTIFARILVGWLCEKIGPRLAYTGLLVLGSIPVMGIGFSQSAESLMVFRFLIGFIGASFVITQYHTSLMFESKIVGTANAITAGWGNAGAGGASLLLPILLSLITSFGASAFWGWRITMILAGVLCLLTAIFYFFLTQDTPDGNFKEVRKKSPEKPKNTLGIAAKDPKVWSLFLAYAACFGVEVGVNLIAVGYYQEKFSLSLVQAGLIASIFGLMAIVARPLGGFLSDTFGAKSGLKGRVRWLVLVLLGEACLIALFAKMEYLPLVIATYFVFALFTHMATGATYGVVPFINKKALGSVSGIVGAGGSFGAVMTGFFFKVPLEQYTQSFMLIAFSVLGCAVVVFLSLFKLKTGSSEETEIAKA